MMTDRTQTPTGFVIERRNWKFGRGTTARRWWHGGDAGRPAFYNALSSTFPVGETFFMSAVRHRSEERRVGKECVRTWRSRWSSDTQKKKQKKHRELRTKT